MPSLASFLVPTIIYFISFAIYLYPLTVSPTPSEPPGSSDRQNNDWLLITDPKPQLDEAHILSAENHDVSPPTATGTSPTHSWKNAWYNDYWGRPLHSVSSHKSWRPLTVWSFRFGKGGTPNGSLLGRWFIGWVGRSFGSSIDWFFNNLGYGYLNWDEQKEASLDEKPFIASELFVHRFVNVMMHAAIVQILGTVTLLLFPHQCSPVSSEQDENDKMLQSMTKYFSQLLFAVHPAHVEAVANAANRPHLLGLMFNSTIIDPGIPLVGVAILGVAGLLSAETALFQFPAVVMTMTAIKYQELMIVHRKTREIITNQQQQNGNGIGKEVDDQADQRSKSILVQCCISLLPRYILLLLISSIYLCYRYVSDTLSIPSGLIRPAENPFYEKLEKHQWNWGQRILNYSYITSLHVLKSFGVEIVGFSHEYGYDCIPEIQLVQSGSTGKNNWVLDLRLFLPLFLIIAFMVISVRCWNGHLTLYSSARVQPDTSYRLSYRNEDRIHTVLLLFVFFSWLMTLLPIAGIIKVGTFVADRIVVPSTFGTCLFAGRLIALLVVGFDRQQQNHKRPFGAKLKHGIKVFFLCIIITNFLARRTLNRTAEWMDSVPLLESSLKACPRSMKSNLEMSKLYSGLVPHMLNFEKAISLIKKAQSIDPSYCDVHQQFAHVYFQQSKYVLFEKEMVKSLLCPFTMGQAMTNWNKYWSVVLSQHGGKIDYTAKKRYDDYMHSIKMHIKEAEKKDNYAGGSKRHELDRGILDEL